MIGTPKYLGLLDKVSIESPYYIQGVQKILCFFTIHCNPSLAYFAVRDLSTLNAMRVYSHSYWLVFLYNQKQPSAGEGEVANFREFLEKNIIFKEHSVPALFRTDRT